jgi:hypothetical protein
VRVTEVEFRSRCLSPRAFVTAAVVCGQACSEQTWPREERTRIEARYRQPQTRDWSDACPRHRGAPRAATSPIAGFAELAKFGHSPNGTMSIDIIGFHPRGQ